MPQEAKLQSKNAEEGFPGGEGDWVDGSEVPTLTFSATMQQRELMLC